MIKHRRDGLLVETQMGLVIVGFTCLCTREVPKSWNPQLTLGKLFLKSRNPQLSPCLIPVS